MRICWEQLVGTIVDPDDRSTLTLDSGVLVAENGRTFGSEFGQPVLLPSRGFTDGGWFFPPVTPADAGRPKPERRFRSLALGLKRWFRRLSGRGNESNGFVERLQAEATAARPLVLIIGGATVGDGVAAFIDHPDIDVAAFDVYATADTTFVADAHRIPLEDASISGVWIQAVLEHVYRPELVVSEIHRVLKPQGLVYAETPFLQPVHEGAYDFARFTPSAHRLLFAGFDEISAGPLGGPGALLALAVRGIAGGVTRSRTAAKGVYILAQPLSLFDRLVPSSWRWDFATGCFFLGRRASGGPQPFDPEMNYRGAG